MTKQELLEAARSLRRTAMHCRANRNLGTGIELEKLAGQREQEAAALSA